MRIAKHHWMAGGLAAFLVTGAGAASPNARAPQGPPPPPPPPVAEVPPQGPPPRATVAHGIEHALEQAREALEHIDLHGLQERLREIELPDFDFEFHGMEFEIPDIHLPDFDIEIPEMHFEIPGGWGSGSHSLGRSGMLELLEMTHVPQGDPAAAPFNEAKTLLFDTRYAEAREKFLQIVQNFPRSDFADDAEFWAAYALENIRGQTESAFKAYEQFVNKNPNSPFVEQARPRMVELAGRLLKSGMSQYKEFIDSAQDASQDEVKLYALRALAESEDFDIVASIRQILADGNASSRLKREAVDLLRRREGDPAVQVLERAARGNADPAVRRRAIEVLGSRGDRAGYDALTRLYEGEESVNARRYIATSVGAYRQADFAAQAATFLARIAERDADEEVRSTALQRLARFANEVSMPHLTRLLQATTDPDNRRLVISQIARSESPDRISILQREAASGDEATRRVAVDYLGRIEGPEALDAIIRIANSDAPEAVRREAVEGMSNFEGSKATQAMIAIARGSAPEIVRREAIERVGDRMTPEVLALLVEVVRGANYPVGLRREAVDEMRRRGSQAVQPLESVANSDSDESLQSYAVETLGRLENGAGWEALARIYAGDGPSRIRSRALDYLWRINEERSLDTVIGAAKEDRDSQIRRHAVQMLGRSDSEKARRALQDILNIPPAGAR